ncbi:MAG: hypothetical protein V3S11_05095 [Elusimicrobiota bacterium]
MATITKPSGDQLLEELLSTRKTAEPEVEKPPKEDEDLDLIKLRKPAPPKRGLCRRCGDNKPINRLMLCYLCWVKTNLEENGWREGMPHPDWCACEGVGGHSARRSAGN